MYDNNVGNEYFDKIGIYYGPMMISFDFRI